MKNIIRKGFLELKEEIFNCWHYLHQHPELSFKEFNTSRFIKEKLKENSIDYDDSLSPTSLIGKIQINNSNEWIAIRADIDALAINEEFESKYKSQNIGVMHACGHDAHTAILLGVAMFLKKNINLLKENILFIFQAGEEKNPGGAKILIDNGLLKKYKIKKIIAQHADPDIFCGNFAFGEGSLMASCDELYIDFYGTGGHAAFHRKQSETVLAATNFISEISKLEERQNRLSPTIIAFGKIIANGAVNIIPDNVRIEGTMRCYDAKNRIEIKNELKEKANYLAKKYNCNCNFIISEGYPNLQNDSLLYKEIMILAKEILAEDSIINFVPRMSSEDFAWYSQKIPALLYRFGVSKNKDEKYPLHNSKFHIEEDAIILACEVLSYFALKL